MREVYCAYANDLVFWVSMIALGLLCLIVMRFIVFYEDWDAAKHKRAYWTILEKDARKRELNDEGHRAPKN